MFKQLNEAITKISNKATTALLIGQKTDYAEFQTIYNLLKSVKTELEFRELGRVPCQNTLHYEKSMAQRITEKINQDWKK